VILTDARRGAIPDPGASSNRTFGDAVAEWLRYVEHEKGLRVTTLGDYQRTAHAALVPSFGEDTPLDSITASTIDAYRAQLLAEGRLSRRTIQKQLVLLHGVLKRARKLEWIRENPAEQAERVTVQRTGEFNVLSAVQVEVVAAKAAPLYAAAITVAAYAGLRTGELRGLRWRDVDWARSTLRVQRNVPVHGEAGAPKSGKVRSVPLMDDAAKALDGLSRRERFTGPDDLVFASETGGVLGEDALRHALYDAMENAGIDRKSFPARQGFTFHDLRHTFGTLAAQVWPLHDVQAFMGHADIQTTMRYAHHVPKHDAAAQLTEFVQREREARQACHRRYPEPLRAECY
jgi:integrase